MAKVKEFVTDALEDILELAAEEPIAAVDGQTAIRYLNDMMNMWAAKGIALGYTVVENMGEDVTIPAGANVGVKAILAISLATKFKAEITPELAKRAKDGWKAILNLTVGQGEREYPAILPMGSGNTYPGWFSRSFYPGVDEAVLTENNGSIALETDTEGA